MSNKANNGGECAAISTIFFITTDSANFQTISYNWDLPCMRDIGRRGDRPRAGAADRPSTGGRELRNLEFVQL